MALGGLVACTTEPTECAEVTSTTVTVTADTGVPVRVRITESGGSVHDVNTPSETVTATGPEIQAARTRSSIEPELVSRAYNPTLSALDACGAELAVDYDFDPASHRIWLTDSGGSQVFGISEMSLHASGTPAADIVLTGFTNPSSPAFGPDGSLWIADANRIHAFRPATLAAGGVQTADVTLSGSAIEGPGVPGPRTVAFDQSGNAWVANVAGNSVSRFDVASLRRSGEPNASIVITGDAIDGPSAIAFDREGNIWIANADGRVVEYLAARLNADITTAPDGELQGQTGPSVVNDLSNPQALAFDADDNLWVAYFSFNIIARYTTAERAMNGPIRPAVQLVLPVDVLLESIAFDDAGGLWFTSAAGKVARLESAALSADGPSSASTILTVASLGYASGIAFNPPSAGLPIAFAEF